ncbi:MAG TPA: ATP-binding protein [Ignavibacteria bacterium]|nr:ATP-binding protein [Ignavibacteria bacterium]HRF65091.1 ATP-binding protein [Ignavibacteria bacterium]HRJ05040.1 ATP-binding protein [Ignavibacteria bacterium]HRJ85228.1 ATP-binding protein [Ignavibacteria bacterium]
MMISELSRQKELLKEKIRRNTGLEYSKIDSILGDVDICLGSMMKLLKDGKSAHEKFFSDIILNSIDAIIGLDNNYRVFLWNKGAEAMFGYKKEEVMGREFDFLIPEILLSKGEKKFLIDEVNRNGFLANYESERLKKNGETINVSISRFAIYDENNISSIGSVGILRDITTVKKLQKELREKENLALIGEVVSSIAHSLSNPLNIISGNADYLLLNKKPGEADHEELKTIVDETTRITKSLRGLLNFSRPLNAEKAKTQINELAEEVISKTRFIIGNKNIVIKRQFDKNLPVIPVDRAQIEEVITNLVVNAIQAFTANGEIILKTRAGSSDIFIEVSDNGPGIPKELQEKIFRPFYSSKGYGKGTGLGLSIVKRIVNEHDGSVKLRSQTGKGTTFTIRLPVK